ncbi:MAG TPA: triose-phosphate isomerase [Candidatus Saccharimonadales bacterium]|jgi:triosephosphate isomerase|nr:triose-phosphate isomerase [Candidatus Saccharimonadales bacterium]
MTKTLIVGNWKMNLNTHQASLLLHKLDQSITAHADVEVVVAPSTLVLQSLSLQVNHHKMKLAAQNCYWRDEGAYTGEVSATMLRGLVAYIIVGHSERRHIFGETNADIRNKVQAVLRNTMTPILCVGETATEKTDGETKHVLHDQIVSGLANVTSDEIENVVIAYEPVWAIGTGVSAKPDDTSEAVKTIRHQIAALYGKEVAQKVRVLYGGSVDGHNAAEFLITPGIDGLLIGGASLKADVFSTIANNAHKNHAPTKA